MYVPLARPGPRLDLARTDTRAHLWRNLAAVIGFWLALVLIGVYGFENRLGAGSTGGEVIVYNRGQVPDSMKEALEKGEPVDDIEANRAAAAEKEGTAMTDEEAKKRQEEVDKEAEKHLAKHESVFSWHRESPAPLLPLTSLMRSQTSTTTLAAESQRSASSAMFPAMLSQASLLRWSASRVLVRPLEQPLLSPTELV